MAYFTGKAILLSNYTGPTTSPTGGYRNLAGQLYDPATVTLRVQLPGAPVTTPATTKDGTGLYHAVVTPSQAGDALYAWVSSDGAYGVGSFLVQPAPI